MIQKTGEGGGFEKLCVPEMENSRPPGFYLMRKLEKLASIMVGTRAVCDRLRSSNFSKRSWQMLSQ